MMRNTLLNQGIIILEDISRWLTLLLFHGGILIGRTDEIGSFACPLSWKSTRVSNFRREGPQRRGKSGVVFINGSKPRLLVLVSSRRQVMKNSTSKSMNDMHATPA